MLKIKRRHKLILLGAIIAFIFVLLYVPWKSERRYDYGNVVRYDVGYAFIWNRPEIHKAQDGSFAEFTKNPSSYYELNGKRYPAWVNTFMQIDYIQIAINASIVILVTTALFIILSIT